MISQHTSKTFITVSLGKGSSSEPSITNEKFLSSYLDHICWMRMISARQQLAVVENQSSGDTEKLAALSMFYQIAGMVAEDALSSYIAWSIWSKDKSLLIPDLLERLSLRLSEPSKPVNATYPSEIFNKVKTSNKRVDVYARAYLNELSRVSDSDLPNVFGINWRRNPSVKLVPKKMLPFWNSLGSYLRENLSPLVSVQGDLLSMCHNKIKHGPQILAMSLIEAAYSRGFTTDQISELSLLKTVRLLPNGSRVQETDEEFLNRHRVAPFLLMDAENMRRWFFQHIVHTSNSLYIHGTWMYNSNFPELKRSMTIVSKDIVNIIEEQGPHLNRVYGSNLK